MSSEHQESSTSSTPEQEPAEHVLDAGERSAKERAWHEWMMVGVGLTGLLSVLAIIVSVVALASKSSNTTVQAAAPASGTSVAMGSSGGSMPMGASKPEAVKLTVKSDSEKAMKGPDGKYHDAVMPANFTVHAGDRVTVTVYNYDDMPHSWTATDLGVNQNIPAGSEDAPSKTTFTFTAPSSAGKVQWWCAVPCDPYAMSTDGLMKGYVTVAA